MLGQVNSNVSAIQLLSAANAFRNVKATTPVEPQTKEPETRNGIDLADNDILKSQNIRARLKNRKRCDILCL